MRFTKLIAAVVGIPMVIGSFAIAVAGGIALAVPDDDGWISAGPIRVGTKAVALVGEDIDLDVGHTATDGRTFVSWDAIPAQIEVASRNDKAVFVGVARQTDALAYLSGVAVDRVQLFEDDTELNQVEGAYSIAPPEDQTFWVASATDGTLDWDVRDGDWAIVVLNADGSPGVDVAVTGSARVPFLGAIGVALIAAGLVGMTFGSLLTYYGVRRVRDPQPNTPAPQAPQPIATS
ncbi:MAG: hypothetical protein U9N84_14375 [Actinomycetota bacterium]|nr:hypothetical protein [Actinomycetota bacterium]